MLYHLDELARERVQARLDEAAAHRAVGRWRRSRRPRPRRIARLVTGLVGQARPRAAYRHSL